jgi:phosphoribosyl-dephospho-CoA transferase
VGDLDVDSSEVMREKEEQLMRQEKWLESYKAKIEVSLVVPISFLHEISETPNFS